LVGSWKLEKNEAVITFEIIADPSGAFGKYLSKNEHVTYNGITSDPWPNNDAHPIITDNGFYTIDFYTTVSKVANHTYIYACEASNDYKTLTAAGVGSETNTSSWVSLVGYINLDNLVVYFRDPVVINRTR
jgi:hypothetical protein